MSAQPTASARYDDIYDPACDLVEATSRMRRVAAAPENGQIAPALLGCIETALQDLAWTTAALEHASVGLATEHRRGWSDRRSREGLERMQRGYANLQDALVDAERAAAAARPLVARALAAAARRNRRRAERHR
jgi:hypothetical protein